MNFEEYFQLVDYVELEVKSVKGEIERVADKQSFSFHFLALDHASSIATLVQKKAFSSALALLRVLYESSIRGCWFKYCASEEQITCFMENDHLPKLKTLVSEVDRVMSFSGQLNEIHKNDMRCLCGFTHSGVIQIISNFDGKTYRNQYTTEQIEAALDFAVYFLRISFMEIATFANNKDIEKLYSIFETHFTKCSRAIP